MIKRFSAVLAPIAILGGAVFMASPAVAGTTTAVATSATGIARGALLPSFSVTVGDNSGQISGGTFQIFDTWKLNPAFRASHTSMTVGSCGIQSISDGNNVDVPLSDLSCSYAPGGASSWSASIAFGPTDTNAGTTYASPVTVTFMPGVFTAPAFATPTTQWRVLARNDDSGVTGLPVTLTFNVIDAVTTPEVQSISCEQGEPLESKPLTTTGMTGTVDYAFVDDPPTGIVIDPATGVVSGTPSTTPPESTWLISVTSSSGQIGSAQITVNPKPSPLPDTGSDHRALALGGLLVALSGAAVMLVMRRLGRER